MAWLNGFRTRILARTLKKVFREKAPMHLFALSAAAAKAAAGSCRFSSDRGSVAALACLVQQRSI